MNKKDLFKILQGYYKSEKTVYAILSGSRRPSYEKIMSLNREHDIPFDVWLDITSYIENDTKKDEAASSAEN